VTKKRSLQQQDRISTFLPLRPVEFYILLALAEHPTHGYGIVVATEERSGGRIRLDTGTLYRALDRLRAAGLLAEGEAAAQDDSRRRCLYHLTVLGREVAAAEAGRLAGLVRDARSTALLDDVQGA
jgi:DNA-binding PadR family transcriptional regulator